MHAAPSKTPDSGPTPGRESLDIRAAAVLEQMMLAVLITDFDGPEVAAQIERTEALAETLGFGGVPPAGIHNGVHELARALADLMPARRRAAR